MPIYVALHGKIKHSTNYFSRIHYYELSQQEPEINQKHQDSEVQIIYMINQVLKSKTSKSKIFDRTPICELFLSLIFEKNPRFGKSKTECKTTMESFHKNL